MSDFTLIPDSIWVDVFPGGQVFSRPSNGTLIIQRDGAADETRSLGTVALYQRCLKLPNGDVWAVAQGGDGPLGGHCIV